MQWFRWRLALAAAGVVLACGVVDQAFAGCSRSRLRNAGVVGGPVSLRGLLDVLDCGFEGAQDVIRQVEENFNGKGGYHRANHAAKFKQKKVEPTALDRIADTLASSRTRLFAKAPLQHSRKWPKADPAYAEVAVIGRSNVGKSSLLNKISQFGTVARVSSMPGQTKEAAWYRNKKALDFVRNRTSLRGLYVLIDARHGFKWSDHEWLSELGSAGPMKQERWCFVLCVVLTKCDLVPDKKLIEVASLVRSDLESYKRVERKVILCSSAWLTGFRDLRKDICERCKLLKGTSSAPKPGARRDDLPLRATKGQDLGIL
eukprot:s6988_g3.t1